MKEKICRDCGISNAEAKFPTKSSRCVPCSKIYHRNWNQKQKETIKRTGRACSVCGILDTERDFQPATRRCKPCFTISERVRARERKQAARLRLEKRRVILITKTCPVCKETKGVDKFNQDKSRKDSLSTRCRDCENKIQKEWRDSTNYTTRYRRRPDIRLSLATNQRNKRLTDVNYKLRHNLRARIKQAIKIESRGGSAVRDLGCDISFFKEYIASLFQPGMSWENWGFGTDKWHLDHIMPLSAFDLTDRQQFILACHYLNMQPLWQTQNLKKHKSMPLMLTLEEAA